MKIFSKFAALALLVTTSAPAFATPPPKSVETRQRGHFEAVKYLAIKAGITLKLNEPHCLHNGEYNSKVVGTYNSKLTTICVVDHKIIGSKLWYSTFYHELFHFVQDSLDGMVGDNKLYPFFTACEKVKTKTECSDLYLSIYTNASDYSRNHANSYASKQVGKNLQLIEREAVLFSDQPELYTTLLTNLIEKFEK